MPLAHGPPNLHRDRHLMSFIQLAGRSSRATSSLLSSPCLRHPPAIMDLRRLMNDDEAPPPPPADRSPSLKRKHSLDIHSIVSHPPQPPPHLDTNLPPPSQVLSASPASASQTSISHFSPVMTPSSSLQTRQPSFSVKPSPTPESLPPRPPTSNGSHQPSVTPPQPAAQPLPPPRKKRRYDPSNLPPWARRKHPRVSVEAGPIMTSMGPPARPRSETPGQNGLGTNHAPPPPSNRAPPTTDSGTWEPSIDNTEPYDEIVRKLCDFLFENVVTAPPEVASMIEVEAKLGILIDQNTQQRIFLPVQTEAVLHGSGDLRFESQMNEAQHKATNAFLNSSVQRSRAPGQNRIPLTYKHTKEQDSFFDLTPAAQTSIPDFARRHMNPRHTPRVRQTVDEKTGQELAKIIKVRLANFDIHSPNTKYDVRISVNIELNYEGSIDSLPEREHGRRKDRMTYNHQDYQIDLTQVTQRDSPDKRHELEVEVNASALQDQGRRVLDGGPNHYVQVVQGFLNNVRLLTRTDMMES
jgi:hypothetical protein